MQSIGTRTQRVQYDASTGTIIITNPSGTTWTHVWNGGAPGGTYADGTGYPLLLRLLLPILFLVYQ